MYHQIKDISIYYEKYGQGERNILILPGWGNTRNTFQNMINDFQEEYSIYVIDYPGFGNSPIPRKELTIYDYAEIIKDFMEKKEIYNPILIAHSFGGRIASILLGKFKVKARKIVLMDVAGIKRKKSLKVYFKEKLYKFLKKTSCLLPKLKQEEYKQKLLLRFASADYKNIPSCMQKTFQNVIKEDLKKYYDEIKEETLIIWGEKDKDTPLRDGYYLKKNIKNSALIIYKNASHFSYLNYPYLTSNILKNFFE